MFDTGITIKGTCIGNKDEAYKGIEGAYILVLLDLTQIHNYLPIQFEIPSRLPLTEL